MHIESDPKIFYRRRLPHYQPPNETFHVTFRLVDSLPAEVAFRLKQKHERFQKSIEKVNSVSERLKIRAAHRTSYFSNCDGFLDRATKGPFWLGEDLVAAKVAETIQDHDGELYDLFAYCLMPNHVHLLATFWPLEANCSNAKAKEEIQGVKRSSDRLELNSRKPDIQCKRTEVRSTTAQYFLTDALRKLKGVTANECNKLLHRRGQFWHHESYDHVVRNQAELDRTVWYILQNPVKAGLCGEWRDWRWSYVKREIIEQWDDA